jgi:hypothetical protein
MGGDVVSARDERLHVQHVDVGVVAGVVLVGRR